MRLAKNIANARRTCAWSAGTVFLLTVQAGLTFGSNSPAFAQTNSDKPVATETTTEVKVDTVKQDATTGSANAAAAPAAAKPAAADGPLVEPGPGEAQRTQLVLRIFNAKTQGIGIDAYLNAFAMLENSVKTGETEVNVLKRVDSINSSLTDQIKRSAVLKTQRPAPPVAASGFPAASSSPSGGNTADLLRRLQEKYGDKIPADLKDKYAGQIPDNLKDKIPAGLGNMDPSQIEDLIKKYKK